MMKRIFSALMLFMISTTLLFAGSASEILRNVPAPSGGNQNGSNSTQSYSSGNINDILYSLANLYAYLEQNSYFPLDGEELQYSLIEAMVNAIGDDYTYYIRPTESDDFYQDSYGAYVGIGILFSKLNPAFIDSNDPSTYMAIISYPFPGMPAANAGILEGDLISHIDGEDISPLLADEVSDRLKGEAGKTITLTVHRGDQVFDVKVTADYISTPSVDSGMLSDDVGYLIINSFVSGTYQAFSEQLDELIAEGAKGIIIDLRNNGGGMIAPAEQIANMFLSSGNIVITKFREDSGKRNLVYPANSYEAVSHSTPIVILVNGNTASASEILTGALKDNKRAIVVGEKTFGKGITQSVIPYLGGVLKVTTAGYLTPSGSDIHGVGIEPDYTVEAYRIEGDDIDSYIDFYTSGAASKWLEEHPDYTADNIKAFADNYLDSGIDRRALELIVRNEYLSHLTSSERPVADPVFDTQLRFALNLIENLI